VANGAEVAPSSAQSGVAGGGGEGGAGAGSGKKRKKDKLPAQQTIPDEHAIENHWRNGDDISFTTKQLSVHCVRVLMIVMSAAAMAYRLVACLRLSDSICRVAREWRSTLSASSSTRSKIERELGVCKRFLCSSLLHLRVHEQ
jgi:hypothetical protein